MKGDDVPVVGDDEPLAVVGLDLRAVLAHQRFDFHLVEAAAREDHAGALGSLLSRIGIQAGDDAVDVGFDVDAGLVLELALTVFLHRQDAAELLAQLGGHDLVDVGVGDDGGVAGDEGELVGPPWRPSALAGNPT